SAREVTVGPPIATGGALGAVSTAMAGWTAWAGEGLSCFAGAGATGDGSSPGVPSFVGTALLGGSMAGAGVTAAGSAVVGAAGNSMLGRVGIAGVPSAPVFPGRLGIPAGGPAAAGFAA